jgi:vancomycin resistance protein YoaR
LALVALAIALVVPWFFAGSPDRLADGTRIAGIDVGGLTVNEAETALAGKAARIANVPVTFTSGGHTFKLTAKELSVRVNWREALGEARRQGGGAGIVRGFRRLSLQFFPENLEPSVTAYKPAVDYELGLISNAVDLPHHEAKLVRRGLHITILPGETGRVLDQERSRATIVAALASFERGAPVSLPASVDAPTTNVETLTPKQRSATRIVSAPVTLVVGPTRYTLPRWRLAQMLDLDTLRLTGTAATAYFAKLDRTVDRPPKDATFAVGTKGIRVVPSQDGIALDVAASAERVLAAAKRLTNRVATLVVAPASPARTTATALAMGITGVVGSYETVYGGDPNRIHNVDLVAHLVDGKLIAPGATFSFNETTGERSAAKGFLEAPVIVNGELQTGLGGGVCQVSTTVFNAAYEAGLQITARTNHALYISHYPLGRDATVDYPDIDLKFVNDTGHWLLLRTFVNPGELSVVLYGTPQHRKVVSVAQPLTVVAAPPVQKTIDATLKPGETVVDDPGAPATSTSVERKVYAPNGNLLTDQTWYSSYVSQPKIVRVGPKKKKAKTTTTGTTTTTSTTTPQKQSPPATTTGPG